MLLQVKQLPSTKGCPHAVWLDCHRAPASHKSNIYERTLTTAFLPISLYFERSRLENPLERKWASSQSQSWRKCRTEPNPTLSWGAAGKSRCCLTYLQPCTRCVITLDARMHLVCCNKSTLRSQRLLCACSTTHAHARLSFLYASRGGWGFCCVHGRAVERFISAASLHALLLFCFFSVALPPCTPAKLHEHIILRRGIEK